jgi:hypothetical protein
MRPALTRIVTHVNHMRDHVVLLPEGEVWLDGERLPLGVEQDQGGRVPAAMAMDNKHKSYLCCAAM